jgi:ABC-type sugar transport system substrate-binding protein
VAAALMFVAVVMTAGAQDKGDPAKAVGALPPHPLDSAFGRGNTAYDMTNGLLNNDWFKDAVKAAEKAKRDRIAAQAKTPIGPSPDQAARQAFLDALNRALPEPIGAPKSK